MKNKAFYLTGSDGSGKTTYINIIKEELLSKGYSVNSIWLRSPKILSKPLMAYCRIVGLTKYTVINGVKYGKHEFYRSKMVSVLFPLLQLIDFKIKWFLLKRSVKDNDILLFDRFSLDTLADLMVDTGNYSLHKSAIGRSFLKMIPNSTKTVVLDVNEATIRERKVDTLHDDHLDKKLFVYRKLSDELGISIIDNNRSISIVKNELDALLNI